jgi:D-alanyl-D-alanine carboxypeptidase
LSRSTFDGGEIPEAIRETVEAPQKSLPQPTMGLAVAGAALLLVTIGIWQLTRPWSAATAPRNDVATTAQPNNEPQATPDSAGRILNHYPYAETSAANLESITADGGIKLHQSAAKAYREMAAAAQAMGVTLAPLSGFRSIADQEHLFFQVSRDRNQRPEERADVSAPPGHSEHHTGYAIDIGDADTPATNLSPDFDKTKAFQWLEQNAARYSFELSFPAGNTQGVTYEPWHWRFVGDSASLETFYKARNPAPPSSP